MSALSFFLFYNLFFFYFLSYNFYFGDFLLMRHSFFFKSKCVFQLINFRFFCVSLPLVSNNSFRKYFYPFLLRIFFAERNSEIFDLSTENVAICSFLCSYVLKHDELGRRNLAMAPGNSLNLMWSVLSLFNFMIHWLEQNFIEKYLK